MVTIIIGPEGLLPISLLPLPGKVLEHLIYTQLDEFLERNNLLRIDNCDARPFGSALFKFRYIFHFKVY